MYDQSCLTMSPFTGSVSFICLSPPLRQGNPGASDPKAPVWELIFADCDRLSLTEEKRPLVLFRNELFIREIAVQKDSRRPSRTQTAGAIVLCFSCASPYLCLLTYLPLHTSKTERILFARMLLETASASGSDARRRMEAFLGRLLSRYCTYSSILLPGGGLCAWARGMNDGSVFHMRKMDSGHSAQMAGMDNPLFLPLHADSRPPAPALRPSVLLYLSVLQYLKRHLCEPLSVSQICADNRTSRSCVERLFRRMGWHGVMDCFSRLKINGARRLIASGSMTFTQIAAALGFSSVFYFSRRFKEIAKMTPSEYAALCREHSGDVIM